MNGSRTLWAVAFGALGAAALVALYLGIVTWAQGAEHAFELLSEDRFFVGAIALGFGTQVGLFSYVRMLHAAMTRSSVAVAGAGTATSSVSMVACCAHHLADVLPVIGISGAAALLVELRTPLMLVGIATNLVGVGFMARVLVRMLGHYRLATAEVAAACH